MAIIGNPKLDDHGMTHVEVVDIGFDSAFAMLSVAAQDSPVLLALVREVERKVQRLQAENARLRLDARHRDV